MKQNNKSFLVDYLLTYLFSYFNEKMIFLKCLAKSWTSSTKFLNWPRSQSLTKNSIDSHMRVFSAIIMEFTTTKGSSNGQNTAIKITDVKSTLSWGSEDSHNKSKELPQEKQRKKIHKKVYQLIVWAYDRRSFK